MGRKKQTEKENTKLLFRDPELVDRDTVGMSMLLGDRMFAAKSEIKQWSTLQQTLFIIALGRIKDWRNGSNNNTVVLNNYNVMKELGWDFNDKNLRIIGDVLRTEFTYMVSHSTVRLQNLITKKWASENFLVGAEGDSKITKVTINPKFMTHCEDLFYMASNYSQSFYTLLEPDVASFKHNGSYLFYSEIRRQCKVSKEPMEKVLSYTAEELREIFGVKDSEYTRSYNEEKNKYQLNHTTFEKYALKPSINEINETELVKVLPWEDDKLFRKFKNKDKQIVYLFKVKVYDIETIKAERQRLYDIAQKSGLNPQFYPDYTESKAIAADWKGNWVIDKKITSEENENIIEEQNDCDEKRNDKLGQNAFEMFGLTSNEPIEGTCELRPITSEQRANIQKSKNKK